MRPAASAITKAELRELGAAAMDFEKAASKHQSVALMNADRRFHELIGAAARDAILQDILDVLHARSQRFWAISLSGQGPARVTWPANVQGSACIISSM